MHVVIIDTSNYDSKLPTPWQHACNKPKYVHALGCRRSLSTVHRTSSKSLPHITSVATHHICCHTSHLLPHITSVATHHICCVTTCLRKHLLSTSGRTNKSMILVQSHWHLVLCSKWDSACFVLLANTCLVVVEVHQSWASEEGLVALSVQRWGVSIVSTSAFVAVLLVIHGHMLVSADGHLFIQNKMMNCLWYALVS